MNSNRTGTLGKREAHNLEQKEALYRILKEYLKKGSYQSITIRNLCSQMGMTTSSFYNMYQTFENFLCQYIVDEFYAYALQHHPQPSVQGAAKIIYYYELMARYSESNGVKYAQFFQGQCCRTMSIFSYREMDNPTVDKIKMELEIAYHEAVCLKEIDSRYESKVIFRYLDLIVSSNLFNWCNRDGKINLFELVRLFLTDFLHYELNDDKYKKLENIIGF